MIIEQNVFEKLSGAVSQNVARTSSPLPSISDVCVFRRATEPAAGRVPLIRDRRNFNCHFYFTLWVCLDQQGIVLVSDVTQILKAGEAMLIMPGQKHVRVPLEHDRPQWLLIRFSAKNTDCLEKLRNNRIKLDEHNISILKDFLTLWNEGKDNNSLGACLLYLLMDILDNTVDCVVPLNQDQGDRSSIYVRELCELLLRDKIDGDPFETVGKKWSVTKEHLHDVFRLQMGYSARDFLNRRKIVLAEYLLAQKNTSITDVALQLGYGSIYAFSRFFKQKKGISPSAYRKTCLKNPK